MHIKKRRRFVLALTALIIAVTAFAGGLITGSSFTPSQANANTPVARNFCSVIEVIDGQTLLVQWRNLTATIQLRNVQAPDPGAPGYRSAKNALQKIINNQNVWLELEQVNVPERGQKGNLKAHIYVGESKTVANLEMVRQGWSKYWPDGNSNRFANRFAIAEQQAHQEKRGLWQVPIPGVRLP